MIPTAEEWQRLFGTEFPEEVSAWLRAAREERDELKKRCEALRHALNESSTEQERKLEAERDLYKTDWQRLMTAIGPYSTTDLAVKATERTAGYKAALEFILREGVHEVDSTEHGKCFRWCAYCKAKEVLDRSAGK